ncbi:MAG: tetratricopeptide repeat protein [Vampirovibrionales bacterium]|nr:tetratricopeptide repeat protein [Vampirovibrionales bacterium]
MTPFSILGRVTPPFSPATPRIVCRAAIALSLLGLALADAPRAFSQAPALQDRLTRTQTAPEPVVQSPSQVLLPILVEEMDLLVRPSLTDDCDWLGRIPSDARQQASIDADASPCAARVLLRVVAPRNPLHAFPLEAQDVAYREPSALIDSDDPRLITLARSLTAHTPYAYAAAQAIHQWVAAHIQTAPAGLSVKQASATLQTAKGSALEKSLLMAALCRAVGIPARIAAGATYRPLGEGSGALTADASGFAYHVWAEAFVSEWTGFDPMRAQIRLDASHLKLADSAYALFPHEESPFTESVLNRLPGLRFEVTRAQAPGAAVVSLSGRAQTQARAIPSIDLTQIDLQRLTRQQIPVYEATPDPHRIAPKEPEGRVTRALDALAKGDGDAARQSLTAAVHDASAPLAAYRLSQTLATLGFYSLAQQAVRSAAQGDPSLAMLFAQRIRADFPTEPLGASDETAYAIALSRISGDAPSSSASSEALLTRDAIATLDALMRRHPGFDSPLLALGRLALTQAQPEMALERFQRYVSLKPDDPRGWAGLAQASLSQKRYREASLRFAKAATLARRSETDFLTRLTPELDTARQIAQARDRLARAPKDADAWIALGQALLRQGQVEEARTSFGNAQVFQPASARARLYYAMTHAADGHWQALAPLISHVTPSAFASGLDRANAYALLALWQTRQGRFDAAVSSLQAAVAADPGDSRRAIDLAKGFDRVGKPTQAITALRQGLDRAVGAGNDPLQRQILRLILAERLLTRAPAQAQTLAEAALQADPMNPEPYRLLATLALDLPNDTGLEEAQRRLNQALALDPDNAAALAQQGRASERQGRTESAIAYYQRALAADNALLLPAQRLNVWIDRLQLPIEKPAIAQPMSPGEYAWLVRILALDHDFELRQLRTMTRLNAVLSNPAELSVRNLAQRRATLPILHDYARELQAFQASLNATAPPARLSALRQILQQLAELEGYRLRWYETILPRFFRDEELVAIHQKSAILSQETLRWGRAYNSEINALFASLPSGQLESALSETSWDSHETTLAQISAIQAELASKMTKSSPVDGAATSNAAESVTSQKPDDNAPQKPLPASAPSVKP